MYKSWLKSLVRKCVQIIKGGGKANQEWSKWSLMTHTVMCAISERAMRDGIAVELDVGDDGGITKYMIGGETFNESMISQQRDWTDY